MTLDRLVGDVGRDRDFDSKLGQEVHDIFGAAIDFGVALLAAVTLDLGHRHAVDADGRQCLAHLVKLERFDDRDDEFHGQAFVSGGLVFPVGRYLGSSSQAGGSVSRRSPANQIWHLSGQMAQKSCRYTGKTFGSGEVAHCTGNMIVRHNGVSPPAAPPAPPFPRKRLKCRTDRGFMHPTASNRALFPKPSCATSSPGARSGRIRWSGPRECQAGSGPAKFRPGPRWVGSPFHSAARRPSVDGGLGEL